MANTEQEELLQVLNECIRACEHCFQSCLREEDPRMMAGCIELDRECVDICSVTANAVARDSKFKKKYLELCAEICETCGNECNTHSHDHCQECAKACFACAEACRKAAK